MKSHYKIELVGTDSYGPDKWTRARVEISITTDISSWWKRMFGERKTETVKERRDFVLVGAVWFDLKTGMHLLQFLNSHFPDAPYDMFREFLSAALMRARFRRLEEIQESVTGNKGAISG